MVGMMFWTSGYTMTNNVPNGLKIGSGGLPRGRPREFDVHEVVGAAKELFWEHGYRGCTIADLETATGLHRSSLYQAFGTKEALFGEALGLYIDSSVAPRLAAMERPGAGPRNVRDFFRGLARLYRDDAEVGRRGCLWVNSLAEFSGRETQLDARAGEYPQRLRAAFANALSNGATSGSPTARRVTHRSRTLAATTLGIWLTVRVDANEAARVCDAVAVEVSSWGEEHAMGRG
jgi:TetR/AcrR family transcriptional regulator, transcriptional repressor for nem operon